MHKLTRLNFESSQSISPMKNGVSAVAYAYAVSIIVAGDIGRTGTQDTIVGINNESFLIF